MSRPASTCGTGGIRWSCRARRACCRPRARRTCCAVWHVAEGKLVSLAADPLEDVRPLKRRPSTAYIVDRKAYAMERSIGRVFADIYSVDLATGSRTKIKDRVEDAYVQASPGGRYLLYLLDDHYWVFDFSNGTHTNITRSVATSFVDRQSDDTVKQKPPFGVAGWTKDDSAVWLYDKFDIWSVSPDGAACGEADRRRGRAGPASIRAPRPRRRLRSSQAGLSLACLATWTKKSATRVSTPRGRCREGSLLWLDKSRERGSPRRRTPTSTPTSRRAFDDSPDYFVGAASLTGAKQVTRDQPVPGAVRVGTRGARRVQERSRRATCRACCVIRPAIEPGQQYPMVVYMYERLSDALHTYVAPSERAPYNASVFTSRGLLLLPARHRLSAARAGPVGGRVRAAGREGGDRERARRCRARGRGRPLVGRFRHRLSRDAHRRVCRRRRRRADHGSRQQLRQLPLEQRHRRNRSHRDRAAADGGADLRRPAGLHPELRGVRRQHDEDAAC